MRWYRTVKLGLHDSCELCAFINLAGWGRFQRTPVECVCVCAFVRTWHCHRVPSSCGVSLHVCVHIRHYNIARASMLSPIMLCPCPMVLCRHPGFSVCRGAAGNYWN